jgi:hypothetical protein
MASWGNQVNRVATNNEGIAHEDPTRPERSLFSDTLPRSVSGRERTILCHPDRQTPWIGVGIVHLTSQEVAKELAACFLSRMERLSGLIPLVTARLGEPFRWVPGEPPPLLEVAYEPPGPPKEMLAPFRLHAEAPLRVGVDVENAVMIVATHHAALDGADTMAIIETLLGKQNVRLDPRSTGLGRSSSRHERDAPRVVSTLSRSLVPSLKRLVAPADPVAHSQPEPPGQETFASCPLPLIGHAAGIRLPAACVLATLAHNARMGSRLQRVGITITRGGPPSPGNVASYRRIDVRVPNQAQSVLTSQLRSRHAPLPEERPKEELLGLMDKLQANIARELARCGEPLEFHVASPAMLALTRPIYQRFSDSLLVSYFGRFQAPGVHSVEGYSVARGTSGIAFGALRVVGGESTLTLRALHLSQDDARLILEDVLWLLGRQ